MIYKCEVVHKDFLENEMFAICKLIKNEMLQGGACP